MKANEFRKMVDDYKEEKIEYYKLQLESILDEAMRLARRGFCKYEFFMWISVGDYKLIENYLKDEGFNVKILDCKACEDNEWYAVIEISWE
jgi:hypothetical protein